MAKLKAVLDNQMLQIGGDAAAGHGLVLARVDGGLNMAQTIERRAPPTRWQRFQCSISDYSNLAEALPALIMDGRSCCR